MLYFTHHFVKYELRKVSKFFTLPDIQKAIKKVSICGISMPNLGYDGCKIYKVRIGSKPTGRMIVLLLLDGDKYIPVVLRLKKDKIIGENLSLANKAAEALIQDNIEKAIVDLDEGRYEKFEM